MRKNLERALSTALLVVVVMFLVAVAVFVMEPQYIWYLREPAVKAMLFAFGAVMLLLGIADVALAFAGGDMLAAVLLFKNGGNATRATTGVVRHWIRLAIKGVAGVKAGKITLLGNENNDLCIKVNIKIDSGKNAKDLVCEVDAAINSTLKEVLGLQPASVDLVIGRVEHSAKICQAGEGDASPSNLHITELTKETEPKMKHSESHSAGYCDPESADADAISDVLAELSEDVN